jgi:hypothetical protein
MFILYAHMFYCQALEMFEARISERRKIVVRGPTRSLC